jgi:DNA-binding NtrC family response regulator
MNGRILVTDDDAVSCQSFAKVLKGEGYEVEWVQTGEEALTLLRAYAWPGNIRELENAMERAVTLAQQPTITADDLPEEIRENRPIEWSSDLSDEEASFFAKLPTLDAVEKHYIQYVVSRTQGNLSHTAKVLDIDRRSLYRMLERLKIVPFHKASS